MPSAGATHDDIEALLESVKRLVDHGFELDSAVKAAAEIFEEPLVVLQQLYEHPQDIFAHGDMEDAIEKAFGEIKRELIEECQMEMMEEEGRQPSANQIRARIDYLNKKVAQRQLDRSQIEKSIELLDDLLDRDIDLDNFGEMEERINQMRSVLSGYDRAVLAARKRLAEARGAQRSNP